jgi:hypothetical protein
MTMTVRQLLDQKYPEWNTQSLLRAAVCTRLLRAGYSLDEALPPESSKAVHAIIKRAKSSPPTLQKVATVRTAALSTPRVTPGCKVCHQPTVVAKLATGDDAYYCLACKAVCDTMTQLRPAL